MKSKRKTPSKIAFAAICTFAFSFICFASTPFTIRLWPGTPPCALGSEDKDVPTLAVYPPDQAVEPCPAVVICPGGGYARLAIEKEGSEIAQWLNSLGVTGIVLKYRLPADGYRHPIPLRDAQRAIRTARGRALEWKLDPKRIAIMGFSAGGHLASTAGTHFLDTDKRTVDAIDTLNCRPDLMVLVYPVVSFKNFFHSGSRNNLLGPNPDSAMVEYLSNETQVTSETPPTFLVHASDDKGVPPENSVYFYLAMKQAGVSAEMHIYREGGHGFGMKKNPSVASQTWFERLTDWLRVQGWVK